MTDRRFRGFAAHRLAPRLVIAAHLVVLLLGGFALVVSRSWVVWGLASVVAGTSLFALTSQVREASHRLLARHRGLNDALGMLAGWPLLTPLSAYRAFHHDHHRATNRDGDPNAPLNARAMLAVGSVVDVALIHRHAIRTLRGRALAGYLVETAAMVPTLAIGLHLLPHAVRERAVLLPLVVVAIWRNARIVTEHLDLPSGRFHDTWQLALPAPLSRWLLHLDHHLEHHLRPGLRWHELPLYRAEIRRGGFIAPMQQVTPMQFAREVFCRRRRPGSLPPDSRVDPADRGPDAPRWAGRAAIRARRRSPVHPPRESIG